MGQGWRNGVRLAGVLLAGASLAACATAQYPVRGEKPSAGSRYKVGAPYEVGGVWYTPREEPDYDRRGLASWYGDAFHMKATANGELFDMNAVTAAHTTLPMPSIVEVTNLDNGRRLNVRVNDRGPFVGGRIIDVSHEAARELGFDRQGLAHVRVRYVGPAPLLGPEAGRRYAQIDPRLSTPSPRLTPVTPVGVAPPVVPVTAPVALLAQVGGGVATAAGGGLTGAPTPVTPSTQVAGLSPPGPVDVRALAPAIPGSPPPGLPELPGSQLPTASVSSPSVQGPPVSPGKTGQNMAALASAAQTLSAGSADPAAGVAYRIQVGAFSDFLNARRAVDTLAQQGKATIEPMQRAGVTLYRVMVPGPVDQAEAFALRDKVAGLGFADARVVRPPSL